MTFDRYQSEEGAGETTILNFRHLLEHHGWGEVLFERGIKYLTPPGIELMLVE